MTKIQDVFDKIQKIKIKQREIKAIYRDALASSAEYQRVSDGLKEMKEKKKRIEDSIKSDFGKEFDKLEEFKCDLETENLLLSDIALNHVMKGEVIEVVDSNDNKYEPLFSVRFRKVW
jgi:uncharacterized protein with ParB-like and HNH nuclease domain